MVKFESGHIRVGHETLDGPISYVSKTTTGPVDRSLFTVGPKVKHWLGVRI